MRVIAADFVDSLAVKMAGRYPGAAVEWVTADLTTDGPFWQSLFASGVDLILDKGCMDAFLVKPVEQRESDSDAWLNHKDDAADALAYLSYCSQALACREGIMLIVTRTKRAVTEALMLRASMTVLSWDDLQLGNGASIVRAVAMGPTASSNRP